MSFFLGIDAGTSGIKALIMDEKGGIAGMGYCECDVISLHPGWAEQSPEMWWETLKTAIKAAVQKSGKGREIKAVSFSGQMQGCTLMDGDMKPLGNCIIWLDQRSGSEVEEIEALVPREEYLPITANGCLNSFWAPKLLWLRKNDPRSFEKARTVLFAKDYLRYMLTGEIAAEVSDSSLSFLLDVPKRKWSEEMFSRLGLPIELAPPMLESQDIAGYLKADIAAELGLETGIPVIAGGGDQPMGGVGTSIIKEGVIGATIGTSAVVFGCTDKPLIDDKRRAIMTMAHAVPNKWCFLGLVLTAGASFKWLRDNIFADKRAELAAKGEDIYDYMTALAEKSTPGSEGLTFLPYLNGEKTPINDPNARGMFFGLSGRHTIGDVCRSVMEGVTFALRDTIEICREFGFDVSEVRANGGGAKSALWRQLQADIYNAEVVTMNMEEGPAAGAAILAAVGSGEFTSVEEACGAVLKVSSTTSPISENVKRYNDYYAMYRDLYPAVKALYTRQAENVARYAGR